MALHGHGFPLQILGVTDFSTWGRCIDISPPWWACWSGFCALMAIFLPSMGLPWGFHGGFSFEGDGCWSGDRGRACPRDGGI